MIRYAGIGIVLSRLPQYFTQDTARWQHCSVNSLTAVLIFRRFHLRIFPGLFNAPISYESFHRQNIYDTYTNKFVSLFYSPNSIIVLVNYQMASVEREREKNTNKMQQLDVYY